VHGGHCISVIDMHADFWYRHPSSDWSLMTLAHEPNYDTSHVDRVFRADLISKLIPAACRELKRMEAAGLRIDAIAFRGMSGCLFAAPLSARMRKPMIMVRKKCVSCGREQSHTTQLVEGDRNAKTYVIVDDFIASGKTVRAIQEAITNWSQATCVGIMTAAVAKKKRGPYVLETVTAKNKF
jgi:adenine/guanine phosphoribosyltransferase-like PRPP-binding protein